MKLPRPLLWGIAGVLALLGMAVLWLAIFGWNWLRAPIERMALEKTGRALLIGGDLTVQWAWPRPRIQAQTVSFANPPWAAQSQLVTADSVAFSLHLSPLLSQHLVMSDLDLVRPVVYLERGADGRKTWLLDRTQQDESARVEIHRLTLDQGVVGYEDTASKTSIRAGLSTLPTATGSSADPGIAFTVHGYFKGLPVQGKGTGDSVLAMRDEATPYALTTDTTVGQTRIQAQGDVTGLLTLAAADMQLALSGDNLNQWFTLAGIAMPATRSYAMHGHLVRKADTLRYDQFSGRVGSSDLAGWLQVITGGKRPLLTGDLTSNRLTLDDLGPVIGARPGSVQAAKDAVARTGAALAVTPSSKRVIPDLPFKFAHWDSVDADVNFHAKSMRQAAYMPLDALHTHLQLKDAVLTLDPLQFGVAGGQINAVVMLDGRSNPIQATAQVQVRRLALAKLLPADNQGQASRSQIGGEIKLAGSGNSVGSMLAHANGSVALVVSGGEISQMVMEKAGLHLWEIFRLSVTGDKQVTLRCAVANFEVTSGNMHVNTLVLDTQVTTLQGNGDIDLAQEKLDLTLTQKTKNTSPLALRSPIHISGNFAKPVIQVDRGRMAVRALGALALGVVNPLLMLIPLVDAGPGKDSDCEPWLKGKK